MVGNTFTRCCIRYSYKFQCQLMTFINFQRFIEFVTSLSTFVKGFTLNRLNSCDLLLKYSKMPKHPYYSRPCNYHKSKLCLICRTSTFHFKLFYCGTELNIFFLLSIGISLTLLLIKLPQSPHLNS